MESLTSTIEKKNIPANEGGLEAGIETMNEKLKGISDMVEQIEKLQKVPHGYTGLGEKVDERQIPALDQYVENRMAYNAHQEATEKALSEAYQAVMTQLTLLRNITGVYSREDALKFDSATGRQPKDQEEF